MQTSSRRLVMTVAVATVLAALAGCGGSQASSDTGNGTGQPKYQGPPPGYEQQPKKK